MALTYFGPTGNNGAYSGSVQVMLWPSATFACPGKGPQVLKELSLLCHAHLGAPTIRVGIYDAAGNRVAQGVAQVTLVGATLSWQGHLTQADITPNPCVLTGGVEYYLCAFMNGDANNVIHSQYETGATFYKAPIDYTAGLPATLPTLPGNGTLSWNIRAGVELVYVAGITKDNAGNVLGSCDVYLFLDNGDNTVTFIAHAVSNPTTGAYSFGTGAGSTYFVVAFKAGAPNVMDVTDRTIVAV